ncbi:hypothetical protein JCM10908_003309 [Rhodotorula pacifica]|uniref:polynucleotide 5'-hydroxyl-kinase n=1 Tax=Rhodotorula pacifica TaxID=1495444 RepID=UPI00318237EA
MPTATKGSKRSRAAAASSSPVSSAVAPIPAPPLPSSSNLASTRPLSAVAARRAAREAAQAAAASTRPSAAPVAAVVLEERTRPDERDGRETEVGPGNLRSASPSPTSTPGQASSDGEAFDAAPAPRKKAKAARYFAPSDEIASARPSSSRMQDGVASEGSPEVRDEYTSLEVDPETPPAWETPRSARRRREKPSFTDPDCVSTFQPALGENIITDCRARFRSQKSVATGTLFFLRPGETLLLRGVCGITPLFGAVSALHATLRADPPTTTPAILNLDDLQGDALHPLIVPNSHPVPAIRALGSTSPSPPIRFIDGQTVKAPSGCSVALLVTDLDTGVGGLEQILTAGGIGHGLGFSARKGKLSASASFEVGGRTWSLLLEPEPSYAGFREDEQWSAALRTYLPLLPDATSPGESNLSGDAFAAMVQGPKRVGKSTFAKLLLNELLDRYEAVAYLDTDLGQAEFTAPGLVSLTVVRRPILGPSFTHLNGAFISHFIGSTSPASDPTDYLAACEALVSTYKLEVEFSGSDDVSKVVGPGRRRRDGAAGQRSAPSKCRERVPLVVNTSGWNKGLGAEILAQLEDLVKPTHVFAFADPVAETSLYDGWHAASPPLGRHGHRIPLPAAFPSPLDSKWTPADLRALALASYFYGSARTASHIPLWETARPLVARPVVECHWGDGRLPRLSSVHLVGGGDVQYTHILHALNGSIVALVDDAQPAATSRRPPFPYTQRAPLPAPASSRTLTLAVVHSIAPAAVTMYLLTPAGTEFPDSVALVKGALETPVPLMCEFSSASGAGTAGAEWEEVPYLSVETGEAVGRRRVRRNLMRKGQA